TRRSNTMNSNILPSSLYTCIRFLLLWFVLFPSAASGQADDVREDGFPVVDSLVKQKCGGCHGSDDRGNMQRISWERATPEGWDRALQRMILLYDVEVTSSETGHILQYLSTRHGLAPDEAKEVAYDVERRIHEDTDIRNAFTAACGRCHNVARVLSWRRSLDDWKELSRAHAVRYGVRPSDEALAFLAKKAALHTLEWDRWRNRLDDKDVAGRWLVTGAVLGRIKVFGLLQMEPSGPDGEFNTRATLQSAVDGSTIIRAG